MIGLAVPLIFWGAVASALVVTGLHFLSVRRPPTLVLPTTRFLDASNARAVSRAARPSDLWLLAMRALALLCAGLAMAGVHWESGGARVVRMVVADRAWMSDSGALLTRVRSLVPVSAADESESLLVWSDGVSSSGALSGLRATIASAFPLTLTAVSQHAAQLRASDSVALVVVVPPGGSATSEGWDVWLRAWPGDVRVIDDVPPGYRATSDADGVTIRSDTRDADDIVIAALTLHANRRSVKSTRADARTRVVRVVRTRALPVAPVADGEVVVHWPIYDAPDRWNPANDSLGAVAARGVALVTPLLRRALVTPAALRNAHPVAWWSDGTIAVLERPLGTGCVREVGVSAPVSGDALLDDAARGLLDALTAPCNTTRRSVPLLVTGPEQQRRPLATVAQLRGDESQATVSRPAWLVPALLSFAVALLLIEMFVRSRSAVEDTVNEARRTHEPRARAAVDL